MVLGVSRSYRSFRACQALAAVSRVAILGRIVWSTAVLSMWCAWALTTSHSSTVTSDSLVLVFSEVPSFPFAVGFLNSPLTILHHLFARNAIFQALAHRMQLDGPRSLGRLSNLREMLALSWGMMCIGGCSFGAVEFVDWLSRAHNLLKRLRGSVNGSEGR